MMQRDRIDEANEKLFAAISPPRWQGTHPGAPGEATNGNSAATVPANQNGVTTGLDDQLDVEAGELQVELCPPGTGPKDHSMTEDARARWSRPPFVWIMRFRKFVSGYAHDSHGVTAQPMTKHAQSGSTATKRRSTSTVEHALRFFQAVEKALSDVEEILIVGPGSAKLELIKHVHKHNHALEPRIVGVETVDHPTDGQFIAYAHRYFHAKDRLRGTVP
jgi:hypothetical protein